MCVMNIKTMLEYGGYEVVKENIISKGRSDWTYKYDIRFTEKRIAEMKKEIELGISFYDYDLHDTWSVEVTEVGFNGKGCLWISIAREQDLKECWDLIEYGEGY